jgi:hypothetical protein
MVQRRRLPRRRATRSDVQMHDVHRNLFAAVMIVARMKGDLSLNRYHAVVTRCDQTTFAPFRFVLNSNFVARGSPCGCHATR